MNAQPGNSHVDVDLRDHIVVDMDVPSWHQDGIGSRELGEFNSQHFGVPASAGEPLGVDDDGARFPSVVGSLWGYRGEGEPYVTLDLGGFSSGGIGVKLRLSEAERLIRELRTLVDAGRSCGPL